MTSVLTNQGTRWLAALVASALVLALMVGSDQRSAQAIGPGETDIAYVADGYNFPDALMGATLAALNAAPMLGVRSPTTGDVVPPETADELDRLTNDKANPLATIYVFGGPAAVSDKVVGELEAWADDVQRIFGDDRFGTMEAISQALPTKVKDSDLLDGMDSSDFLGATEKAADSELLDGQDSMDFASASEPVLTWHATAETFASPLIDSGTEVTVASLTVDVPDACGDGSTNSRIIVEGSGNAYIDTGDGTYAFASATINIDGAPATVTDDFGVAYAELAVAQVGQTYDADALPPVQVFDDVTPGSHTFNFIAERRSGNTGYEVYGAQLVAKRIAYACGGASTASASTSSFSSSSTPERAGE